MTRFTDSDAMRKFLEDKMSEAFLKGLDDDMNRILYGIDVSVLGAPDTTGNGDGTYTHTWNNIPIVTDPSVDPNKIILQQGRGMGGKTMKGFLKLLHQLLPGDTEDDTEHDTSDLEHTPGAFAGFRAFRIGTNKSGEAVLESMSTWGVDSKTAYGWSLSTNEASCGMANTTSPPHGPRELVPVMGCTCGFWAYSTYEWLCDEELGRWGEGTVVYALVAGWGKYVQSEYGFRTQFMRPLAIIEPHPHDLKPWCSNLLAEIDLPHISLAAVPTIIESHGLTTLSPVCAPCDIGVAYVNAETESTQYSDVLSGAIRRGEITWDTGPIRDYRNRAMLEAMLGGKPGDITRVSSQ